MLICKAAAGVLCAYYCVVRAVFDVVYASQDPEAPIYKDAVSRDGPSRLSREPQAFGSSRRVQHDNSDWPRRAVCRSHKKKLVSQSRGSRGYQLPASSVQDCPLLLPSLDADPADLVYMLLPSWGKPSKPIVPRLRTILTSRAGRLQMYNALTGLGGSGQVDSTVAANATVALLSATAVTALAVAGPVFSILGPRISFLMAGWTYALYSGSLLNFNHTGCGAFVIGSGAVLGVGAAFIWIVQGAIMTTYVDESQRGRAIAVFWIIFNLGGGIGSLASFGLNYDSQSGRVSNSTYVALMAIMLLGWTLGVFICSPSRIRLAQLDKAVETEEHTLGGSALTAIRTIARWRVLCMLPLFFTANVFYSYQQNQVNGQTFNIRTRSLNGALYWIAQMLGGLLMGLLLDVPCLDRPARAKLGWAVVFASGMAIWGGGYRFQQWQDARHAAGHHQDLDFKRGSLSAGPILLYIFYGAYDALWQGYAYWLIGTESNSSARAAVLVGAYKSLQAAGGAMAWRVNAQKAAPMSQFGMNWGLCIGSLIAVLPTVWTVSKTTATDDEANVPFGAHNQPNKVATGIK
ncbi:Major facilitator superfamily domain, general substrate transporter [Metarhizium album ARSEF 1941]|uniref:Major facilitator superfamily domain, general substrate transporter n=1 Tax=Metarhizium album (strain ARSEF 1941) TaxID=1081103 RepID=A0A0B2WUQ1_METAS|nr:Major facilitator superfamily domain, general substrate transporter [Metarhizium album ARSEF 1941]KHN97212.1 Major facilitator superfamily domain, general substrate transporter [Metarhizium album ARSEF 1941]